MNWPLYIVLILHVGGAIFAFGATLVFPFIGSMGGKEPQHINFSLRLGETIAQRLVVPLALFQAVTGVALIWITGINVFANLWLLLAIVLYVIAMVIVFTIQLPVGHRLIEATSAPPPPPAGAPAPSGPPPHIAALVRRSQLGGMVLTLLLVIIIILMVGVGNGFLT